MLGELVCEFGSHENESFAVVGDAGEVHHLVVVVQ
jgi:hypothetical protein